MYVHVGTMNATYVYLLSYHYHTHLFPIMRLEARWVSEKITGIEVQVSGDLNLFQTFINFF